MPDQRLLRGVTLAILGVAGVAIVLAFIPGIDVYKDANDCFGEALGNLFSTESRHHTCTPSWRHVGTVMSGGPWVALVVLGAALPAILTLRWRRWAVLLVGIVFAIIAAWLLLIWYAFGPGGILSTEHYDEGWPYGLLIGALLALLALQIIVVPIAAIIAHLRSRPPRVDLPVARSLPK